VYYSRGMRGDTNGYGDVYSRGTGTWICEHPNQHILDSGNDDDCWLWRYYSADATGAVAGNPAHDFGVWHYSCAHGYCYSALNTPRATATQYASVSQLR